MTLETAGFFALFFLGVALVIGIMYYSRALDKQRGRNETEKKLRQADEAARTVASLSARDLVERANRRWHDKLRREAEEERKKRFK